MSTSTGQQSASGGGADPAPKPSRRVFSPEYKLAMVAEYENAPNGEKGAILRREGLYSSHIIEWTRARDAGHLGHGGTQKADAGTVAAGPQVKKSAEQIELEKLRRQNEKLQADLKKTRMALDIMGKSARALGRTLRERGQRPAAEEVLTAVFDELRDADISVQRACTLAGVSRATYYRRAKPVGPRHGPWLPRTPPPQALSTAERDQVLALLNSGLHAEEVMQFDNGYYVELVDRAGNRATETLVDPQTGAVQNEWGPAMMWNTRYGMHPAPGGGQTATVSADQARGIADQWLRGNRPGEHAGEADAFPGYYTLHTMRGNQVISMLSVHATSGAVWYHSWHGRFIGVEEHPG